MADDWRVTVELDEDEKGLALLRSLDEMELASEARERLGDRVAVSRDGPRVFLYADTEAAAREGERVVRSLLDERARAALVTVARWHPEEQRWEDAAVPLPQTDAERQVEHERLEVAEAGESRRKGVAAWEVRVELEGHEETSALAERLEQEGIPVVRRWTYLLVGAANEDEARTLAERLRAEAPRRARVEVQPGGEMAWQVAPDNPFAVFGGLGG
jgi:anion-transporting  ArsA/GET3 family ATPase